MNIAQSCKECWEGIKDIVCEPEQGTRKMVEDADWGQVGIITAIYALFELIFGIWYKIDANFDNRKRIKETCETYDMNFNTYVEKFNVEVNVYGFGDILKGMFMDVLQAAAGIAVTALVLFFAVKLIAKLQITWKQAFMIAVLELIVIVPVNLLYKILGIIPSFTLLTWIMSAVWAAKSMGSMALTLLGIRAVCSNMKDTVYVAIATCFAGSVATALVNFLIF